MKEFECCSQILADSILGRMQGHQKYIAILQPDGEIKALNLAKKTWHKIPSAYDGGYAKIFTLNKKLRILTKNKICFLRNDDITWKEQTIMPVSHQILPASRDIIGVDDCIYITYQGGHLCYDSSGNKWNESFPFSSGQGEDFCVAAVGEYVFTFGSKGANRLHMTLGSSRSITAIEGIQSSSSAAALNGKIYIVGLKSGKTKSYNPETSSLKDVKEIPVPNLAESCVLAADDKLIALVKAADITSVFIYEEWCDQWIKLTDVPEAKSKPKESGTTPKPASSVWSGPPKLSSSGIFGSSNSGFSGFGASAQKSGGLFGVAASSRLGGFSSAESAPSNNQSLFGASSSVRADPAPLQPVCNPCCSAAYFVRAPDLPELDAL